MGHRGPFVHVQINVHVESHSQRSRGGLAEAGTHCLRTELEEAEARRRESADQSPGLGPTLLMSLSKSAVHFFWNCTLTGGYF